MSYKESLDLFLFDIEGTTTPISFVHDVLFPYSMEHIEYFILNHRVEDSIIKMLVEENINDFEKGNYKNLILQNNIPQKDFLIHYLKYLISNDRKSTPLKEIQGKIWEEGFLNGELKSQIYPDVVQIFHRINKKRKKISIFSSGSVDAQKLIFKYSNQGDLTKYISNYFDTKIGNKRDISSYLKIAQQSNLNPSQIIFFTDIKEEADASSNAGFEVRVMERPGNKPQESHNYMVLKDFIS